MKKIIELIKEKDLVNKDLLHKITTDDFDAKDLVSLADALGVSDQVSHLKDHNSVMDDLSGKLKMGNLYAVANKLKKVDLDSITRNELFMLDGFDNYRTITYDDSHTLLEEILNRYAEMN